MTDDVNSDLTEQLRSHDKAAWNAVSAEYMPDLYGFVFRIVRLDRSVADDIVQDVWLESLNRIMQFDPNRGEFRGWLFEIARRKVAGYWRRRASMPLCDELNPEAVADSYLLPTEIMDQIDRAALVRAALLAISPDRRSVLTAKYEEGQSVADIAAMEGKSVKAVESLLSRARDELRQLLGPHFESASAIENAAFRRFLPVSSSVPETLT